MEINFKNINFDKDLQLTKDIEDINIKIKNICNNLPALNIVKDNELLNSTIFHTEKFIKNERDINILFHNIKVTETTLNNKINNIDYVINFIILILLIILIIITINNV